MIRQQRPVDLSVLATGAVAGFAGTLAMMAMRSFDQKYAPKTIPKVKKDPGELLVEKVEGVTSSKPAVPGTLEDFQAQALHLTYGTIAGMLYSAIRGRRRHASTLIEGGIIGISIYLIGYDGWLPSAGLTCPICKQTFPQVAGEALRHMAFGITTAAVYGVMNAFRK